jgi:toxin HigB-1
MDRVDFSNVEKQLKKVPQEILFRLMRWIRTIEEFGLNEARRVKGYHDEPLKGLRIGQRSVRLGIKWRAIYTFKYNGEINIVKVEDVTPHDYRTK